MESCQEAYQEAAWFVDQIDQSGTMIAQLALALHSIQDSYSSPHQYSPWDGHLTMAHIEGDAALPDGAQAATQQFFQDLLTKGRPDSATKYLNPPSVCSAQ